jgi:hypothetical protein
MEVIFNKIIIGEYLFILFTKSHNNNISGFPLVVELLLIIKLNVNIV